MLLRLEGDGTFQCVAQTPAAFGGGRESAVNVVHVFPDD